MASNYGKVCIDEEGYLEMVYVGNISEEMLNDVLRESDILIEQIIREGRSPMLLANINELKKTAQHARKNAMAWVKHGKLKKIGVFGNSLSTKYLVNFMAKAIGWQKKFKYFSTREDACAWLANGGR